jgi:hypothetical protein
MIKKLTNVFSNNLIFDYTILAHDGSVDRLLMGAWIDYRWCEVDCGSTMCSLTGICGWNT